MTDSPGSSLLAASVESLRRERRRALLRLAAAIAAILVPIRACVLWKDAGEGSTGWAAGASAPWVVLALFLVCWGAGSRFLVLPAIGSVVDRRDRLRRDVFLPLVVEAFPGARFEPDGRFDRDLYASAGLFAAPDPDMWVDDGLFSAEPSGRRLVAGELWLRKTHGRDTYLCFRGFFCAFTLKNPVRGRVVFDPLEAPFPTNGPREGLVDVPTGDPELDRRYRIRASGPEPVRELLTPSLRATLVAAHDRPGAPCAVAFVGDRGFVAEQSGRPLLDDNVLSDWDNARVDACRITLGAISALVAAAP